MNKPNHWIKISIKSSADQAEFLTDLLESLDALSVSLVDGGEEELFQLLPDQSPLWQETRIEALYPGTQDPGLIIDELKWLSGFADFEYKVEIVEEEDWVRLTQSYFQPIHFENRLSIYPSWLESNQHSLAEVRIDPGLAFGTGTHPTTRLCLDYLAFHPPINQTVIDYGCGSGILALAAAALGAQSVWATDLDPQALESTRNNAALNPDLTDTLSISLPHELPELKVDLLIANILANPLLELAPILIALLKPSGTLLLSGLMEHEVSKLLECYQPQFQQFEIKTEDGWARIAFQRKNTRCI